MRADCSATTLLGKRRSHSVASGVLSCLAPRPAWRLGIVSPVVALAALDVDVHERPCRDPRQVGELEPRMRRDGERPPPGLVFGGEARRNRIPSSKGAGASATSARKQGGPTASPKEPFGKAQRSTMPAAVVGAAPSARRCVAVRCPFAWKAQRLGARDGGPAALPREAADRRLGLIARALGLDAQGGLAHVRRECARRTQTARRSASAAPPRPPWAAACACC